MNSNNASVAAIKYALETDEGLLFLQLWNEGEFDVIREEWSDVPKEVFIGADPLIKDEKTIDKIFGLIVFDKWDFLREKGKVIKTTAINHNLAMDYFLEHFESQLLNKNIMSFCFDDNKEHYGYEYSGIAATK